MSEPDINEAEPDTDNYLFVTPTETVALTLYESLIDVAQSFLREFPLRAQSSGDELEISQDDLDFLGFKLRDCSVGAKYIVGGVIDTTGEYAGPLRADDADSIKSGTDNWDEVNDAAHKMTQFMAKTEYIGSDVKAVIDLVGVVTRTTVCALQSPGKAPFTAADLGTVVSLMPALDKALCNADESQISPHALTQLLAWALKDYVEGMALEDKGGFQGLSGVMQGLYERPDEVRDIEEWSANQRNSLTSWLEGRVV